MKRIVHLTRLKPEAVEQYLRLHEAVPAAVRKAYRDAGITDVSCFLNGCDLIVFTGYDETLYPASRVELEANEAEIRWQQTLAPLVDQTFKPREFREVFRMNAND